VHESFSEVERRLADDPAGARRVGEFHRQIFDHSAADLLEHVRRRTGVVLRGALAHVDPATRSVFKTLATSPEVDLFLLGPGLPALGVPVNAHLQANGISGTGLSRTGLPVPGMTGMEAAGNGADRR
jgi:anti-sigma factor RsiW